MASTPKAQRAGKNTRVTGYSTIVCPNCKFDNGVVRSAFPTLSAPCQGCGELLDIRFAQIYDVKLTHRGGELADDPNVDVQIGDGANDEEAWL